MTIRRRLTLSFLAILALLALNLVIYFWSNQRRSASVEGLRRAIARQIFVGSVKQNLNDVQKQVALLSQVVVEAATGGAGPEAIAQFNGQLDSVTKQILELQGLSDVAAASNVETFGKAFDELSGSWKIFYENFGVNHAKAIMELVTRAEPLSQRVLQQLAQLQENEKAAGDAASANFYQVAEFTDQMTILIFAISSVVAIFVAYRVSRYLTRALGELKLGAALIGGGHLEHRISVKSSDELGDLARAFNDMTDNLLSARTQLTETNKELESRNQDLEKERQVSESLLLNILPFQVAKELQDKGAVDPKYFEDVTILFADFVGFTLSTETLAAEELVHLLHDYFTAFDRVVARYGLEKLKTIGDSYMCAGGLPARNPSHPVDAVMAAFELVRAVTERDKPDSMVHWAVRIGVHTGPVIAGVVGIQKFAFDIWGDTVNFSSRMESAGAPNRINISERTYSRVKDFFECEYRGKVLTKEKKEFDMYFAKGLLKTLLEDGSQIPPPAFLHRYHIYFQKEPPAFPGFLVNGDQEESYPTVDAAHWYDIGPDSPWNLPQNLSDPKTRR